MGEGRARRRINFTQTIVRFFLQRRQTAGAYVEGLPITRARARALSSSSFGRRARVARARDRRPVSLKIGRRARLMYVRAETKY